MALIKKFLSKLNHDFVEELEPEEIIPEELVVESEEPHEIIEPQDEIIASVIRNLDDMRGKTQVKEEVDQISSIRKEFDNFRSLIAQQIASSQMSGAGSGEVRLEFLDDVDRDTAKVDGKALVYDSSSGKWKGESVLTAAITGLDIDGGTDIGAALLMLTFIVMMAHGVRIEKQHCQDLKLILVLVLLMIWVLVMPQLL